MFCCRPKITFHQNLKMAKIWSVILSDILSFTQDNRPFILWDLNLSDNIIIVYIKMRCEMTFTLPYDIAYIIYGPYNVGYTMQNCWYMNFLDQEDRLYHIAHMLCSRYDTKCAHLIKTKLIIATYHPETPVNPLIIEKKYFQFMRSHQHAPPACR